MAFNVEGALKAGYSRAEIADFLASENKFDATSARKAGYSDDEIVAHLAGAAVPNKPAKPTTFEGKVAKDADNPGLIDRATQLVKDVFTPSSGSVMDSAPPVDQQAEIDKRLALDQGPISPEAVTEAQNIREGKGPRVVTPGVGRVVSALNKQGAPTLTSTAQRVQEEAFIAEDAQAAREADLAKERQRLAREYPITSSAAAGGAALISGVANIPSLGVDVFNQTFINPILSASGLKPMDRMPTAFGTEFLAKSASDYTPYVSKQGMGDAYKNDEFGRWLVSKIAANSPQMAMSLAAAFAPPLRALLLPTMGATAAGQSYAQGEDSYISVAKGLIEVGTEMLPLKVFDRIPGFLKGFSVPKQNAVMAVAAQRLLQTGTVITANSLTNAIEETAAQFGGNVLDKYFQGKDIELTNQLGEAAVIGAATGGAMSTPQVVTALAGGYQPLTPEQEIARTIDQSVANIQPVGTREAAVAALNPQAYDQTLISLEQATAAKAAASEARATLLEQDKQAATASLQQAATASDAIAAAEQLAGDANDILGPVPVLNMGRIEPTLGPVAEIQQIPGRVEPTMEAPVLPVPSLETSQQLDQLRLAPRPQRINGQPVASLSDDQLREVVTNYATPAITRRGAQVELDARAREATTTLGAPSVEDNFISIPEAEPAAVPNLPAAQADREVVATEARTAAQQSLERWAAANNVEVPAQLNPAPDAETAGINQIADALGSQFGGKLYAYHDTSPTALNGLALSGRAFVNTANVDINTTRTTLHEFKHTVEQIALAEARQGLTDTPAQRFVAAIDSLYDDNLTEKGKRAYLEKFLAKAELAGITDPAAREARIQELIADPVTRSEMTADFLGNRAVDKQFWADVAQADPEGFKGFVEKWLDIIDNLMATLRGKATQGRGQSAKVDAYMRDLVKAKMVAREALIAYRKDRTQGEQRETNIPAGVEGVQQAAERGGPVPAESRRGELPSYGEPIEGAISVVGRHYSPRVQTSLSGNYYGTGIRGAEAGRLRQSTDSRIGNRIYFYVDTGKGIRPESGVGRFAHEVRLNNIYDPATRLIPSQPNANAFESAVIDAGFDGYIAPFGNGGAVVLLGNKHDAVPVQSLEEAPAFAKREKAAPARVMFEVAPDPKNAELKTRWDAVPFERKIEISQRVAEKIMPQVFKLAGVRAKMTTQLGGYLDDTSPSFAALVPDTASAQQLMDVARLGGFGLAQDSMMVLDSKPFEGSSPTGLITITLPENMVDQESVHAIYRDLRQVSPENISGHTTVGQEMVLAVPSDSMDDLASKIESVLGGRPENFILKTGDGQMAFPSKEEYDYGQEGTGSPELLAKRAEARRIREEASAAIEDELAKDESAGGRQIDTGVYRSIADDFGLSQAEYNASALPMMLGKTGSNTFRAPKIGGIPEVVEWLDKRYRDAGMASLDLNKAEDRTTLARIMAAEAVGAIRSAGTAVEWYDDTIRKTLQIMAVKYPKLNTDANARNAFLMAVAISSQTMNVEDNLRYASNQYEAFRKTGKFPEVGTGKSAPAMGKNFALANSLLEEMKPELLRRFLQTEFTKRELESIGFKISGESMNEKMLGSAVFGPKIGFGFYSNLSGNFEPVTMDMWFMRTIGRLTGKLPAFDENLFDKQVANLRSAIAEKGDSSRGLFAADFDQALVDEAMKSDDGAIALARAVNSLHNRQFIKERAKFDSKERYKTNLVGAAGTILKSADKPKDSPGGGGERQRLRDVVRQMVEMVEQQTGKRVPPAALQALIWYPEQELYKKLGVKLRVTSQDYAGAAKSLLTKEGFDGKRISAAAESGSGPARQMAGGKVAGPAAKAGAKGESTGPLKGKEREAFVRPRVAEKLAQEAKAKPLAELFAGLNKRGLAKTRAEAAVKARPDAAQINYVQNNFLDILSELEDSGKVKINCD